MWILFAVGSVCLPGLLRFCIKCGIRKTDSNAGDGYQKRFVVLIFAWVMAFVGVSEYD